MNKLAKRLRQILSKEKNIRTELFSSLYIRPFFRAGLSIFFKKKTPEKWIFLVGCYNSGTTILRDILGEHGEISCLPKEGVRYTNIFKRPDDIGWVRNWVYCKDYIRLPSETEDKAKSRIIKDWSPFWDSKKSFFLEKSISNIERMEWIDKNFDNVYFLGILRSGYAVSEGIKRKAKPKAPAIDEYGSSEYSYTTTAEQWVMANTNMLEYAEKVSNFKLLRYEQFAEKPVELLDEICTFLGLENSFEIAGNEVTIGQKKVKIQNMNHKSLARLNSSQRQEINAVAKPLLTRLNYEIYD
ncbi:MAG: sulfotransferase [Roseivirga sp.]|nr:sulfotransferase [Roseivirga sp.]